MTIKVVGAGLGRTGTHSLQLALQQLLDGPCYHMLEVFGRPDDIPVWHAAVNGDQPDWNAFLAGYEATVDWPACSFWREISAANPDAIVLLSSRDTDGWWKSANNTIFATSDRPPSGDPMFDAQRAMAHDMFANTFTPGWKNESDAKRAFEAHNADVLATAPKDQLVDWHPGDGWGPICEKLGIAEPSEPFPHVNTTDDFRTMLGMEPLK